MIQIRLSTMLGERRMNQSELARKTKIRPATLNEYYHDLTERINLEHFNKICEVLQCDISDLLEYIPDKNIE